MAEMQHSSRHSQSGPRLLSAAALQELDDLFGEQGEQEERLLLQRRQAMEKQLSGLEDVSDLARTHAESMERSVSYKIRLALGEGRSLRAESIGEMEREPQIERESPTELFGSFVWPSVESALRAMFA